MLWISDILVRNRIRGSVPLTFGSGSCFFRQRLTRCQQKKFVFKSFFCLLTYFLKVHLHQSSKFKDKKSKRSHKIGFSSFFFYVDGRIRIRTNNDGSGRPKNMIHDIVDMTKENSTPNSTKTRITVYKRSLQARKED